MRVAVTGSAGYLGQLVLAAFDADPAITSLLALDVRPSRFQSAKLTDQLADVRTADFRRYLDGCDAVVHLAFIVQVPPGMSRQTIDDINVAKFTPFPGPPLYREIHERGTFDEDWPLMNAMNFVFLPKGFRKEELEKKYGDFYRRFYGRPRALLEYLSMIWKSPDSWRRFLKDLGGYVSFVRWYRK